MSNILPIQKQEYGSAKDIFCSKCLTHERHFINGQSWSPDLCPCGCQDTIFWKNMGWWKRYKAQKVYDKNEL